jgi:hypothetical protein
MIVMEYITYIVHVHEYKNFNINQGLNSSSGSEFFLLHIQPHI